jgi:MYXO-CTERM domain-containing protein
VEIPGDSIGVFHRVLKGNHGQKSKPNQYQTTTIVKNMKTNHYPALLSGVLSVLALTLGEARAQTVNFFVKGSYTYAGLGAAPDASTNVDWNAISVGGTDSGAVNSDGSASAVTLTFGSASYASHGSVSSPYTQPVDLFRTFTYSADSGTLNNVAPGTYDLYLYGCNANYLDGRTYAFTASTDVTSATTQITSVNSSDTAFVLGQNYVEFTGLTVGSGEVVNFSVAGHSGSEADFNGLQLQATPEPSTWAFLGFGALGLLPALRRKRAA